ncbi:hypothetical protein [Noviherbaspirillum aridicola]|uniref:Uncharacterized protein n=1 Tax=Noviherbaspirillum aridicola TaxID=2849687 RepID=A0ABQ4Q2R1_9BURK|nr:hypothetical protein [Noviherbaspirillum aridicola]GIZ51388.1 hypothetical protein NCCP691_14020 [Noviherbaspirillum aridicola]
MTIRREDLAAAASLGLLQHSQVDPLLIFLLQRDVLARRAELAAAAGSAAAPQAWLRAVLWYTLAFLAVLTVGLFGVLYLSRSGPGAGLAALLAAVVLYAAAGVKLASWSRGRGYCRGTRVTLGVVMASVPLAALVVHQAVAF